MCHGEFQTFLILLGKGADAQVYAWKIEPFAGSQFTGHLDLAMNIIALHFFRLKLDHTIIDKQLVPWPYRLGKPGKGHRDMSAVTHDVFRRQCKVIPGLQCDGFLCKLSNPDLWTWEVGHDGDAASNSPCGSPDVFDHLRVPREIPM